ncbi:MAG: pirin family protein [Myxococcota bacterium]
MSFDPFLFCVHHQDFYPQGGPNLGPDPKLLQGRPLGQDFGGIDGWRMYHGESVPGFPRHPHRGFETITLARKGFIDHADSLGATARFGQGDVQWMTAARGIEHAEMFPLLKSDEANTCELFQIWLNLPAKSKFADPYFTMLWNEKIPRVRLKDEAGRITEVLLAAGRLGSKDAPPPPPDSFAAQEAADVAVWTIKMESSATWTLPPARPGTDRTLYWFEGSETKVAGEIFGSPLGIRLRADAPTRIESGPHPTEYLLLQGRPIGEPVAHHGPFVMNSPDELRQAFVDYRAGKFGRWPWPAHDPVHAKEEGRFAIHADGRKETP